MELQKRLREILKDLSISQVELAKRMGITVGAINSYLGGKRKPNYDVLIKFHNLGYSIDWLLTGSGGMKRGLINHNFIDKYDSIIFNHMLYSNPRAKFKNRHEFYTEDNTIKSEFYRNYIEEAINEKIFDSIYGREIMKTLIEFTVIKSELNVVGLIEAFVLEFNKSDPERIVIKSNKEMGDSNRDNLYKNLGCILYLKQTTNNFINEYKELDKKENDFEYIKNRFIYFIEQIENNELVIMNSKNLNDRIRNLFSIDKNLD